MADSFFSDAEFACPCRGCGGRPHPRLIEKLSRVRASLGSSIRVTSGVRCQAYQDELARKGHPTAKFSSHVPGNYHPLFGIAADITCAPEFFDRLLELARTEFMCLGIGQGWIHVDLREDKARCWTY